MSINRFSCLALGKDSTKISPTMMANHGKADDSLNFAILHSGFRKASIHLVYFAWPHLVTEIAGSLRNYKNPFGRNKVMILLDIPLHLSKTAIIPRFTHSVEANLGVCHPFLQEQIKYSCKSSKNGAAGMHTSMAMGLHLEIIFLQTV